MASIDKAIERVLRAEARFGEVLVGDARDDAMEELFAALGELRFACDERDRLRLKNALS